MNINRPEYKYIAILFLMLAYGIVQAGLPPSLNYQGHLTDDIGAPVNGAVSMSFRIYNVDTGGTVLWSDTLPVTVQHGVFSIELGSIAKPFPLGLFEQPLWIGLEVETDGEMAPRRPLTSTGFAYKADDANTLEGVSASTLDQSSHVSDTANPHSVTAAQVGAADAGTLSTHTGDTGNPHSVTAAQTGAASSTSFTSHTSDGAAHHLRYTNGEAVAAMGAKADANALHHDKYSNSNAVAAILAADGAGSTLDSDKVDGLEASEIIDAAQDEVRTPISSLPAVITQPGSYYLTGNLDGSAGGMNISTDDVSLDMMGFTIDGGGTIGDYGIYFGTRNNITIRNGTIKGFGFAGVYQYSTTAGNARVVNVRSLNNGTLGTSNAHSGIFIAGLNTHIEGCTAGGNGGHGIYAGTNSKLLNNTAYSNTGYYSLYSGIGSILSSNTVYDNTGGYGIYAGASSRLVGNNVYNNTVTEGIYTQSNSVLSGNTSYSNTGRGIRADTGSYISGNTVRLNGATGILAYEGSTVMENTVYINGATGIDAKRGCTVINNTVYSNARWGIYGFGLNIIKDNTLSSNNTLDNVDEGGIYVGYSSRVTGNTVISNKQNNIYVNRDDSSIENNLVTGSVNGIFFSWLSSGNFYGNNRASGNTINYNLNSTSQSTSASLPNISF
jgi:parallel beta-helix repeat protein/putative cofactor-binding repeat protein